VDRLPEFYERVRKLPYTPGPAAELSEAYRRMSPSGGATIYEAYLSSPAGLECIMPLRWVLNFPVWAKARIAGVASWQWVGLVVGLVVCLGFVYGAFRLGRRLAGNTPDETGPRWHALLTPLAIILVSAVPVALLCATFRIGGTPRIVITFIQTGALYLSAAWVSMIAASLLAEAIVASEHLRTGSLDSQLIRLGMRFAGIAIVVGLLIQGSWELGFPTYSVLAGLGVGGLAVALAARDSLANLLGSMLIMIEKPFRVGHYVRVSGGEGTVEDVGFRSTRIRRSPWPALSEDSDDICTRGAGSIGNVRWFQSDPEQDARLDTRRQRDRVLLTRLTPFAADLAALPNLHSQQFAEQDLIPPQKSDGSISSGGGGCNILSVPSLQVRR